ncbi:MAG: DUF4388 domain-containing protein, partial [Desulfobacterales bacterium]|nr:DUF4388 domain-containing protein [Desulfobacterales bacterium]
MSNIVLQGDLGYLNLGDVIQLLGSNGSSGVLRLTSPFSEKPGVMYLVNGNVVDADSGTAAGLDGAYALFGWLDAQFEFSLEPVERENALKKARMELILDGLRMVDDGLIKPLGPPAKDPTGQELKAQNKPSEMPLIKGPLVDYMYVVDEEEFFEGEDIVIEGKHGSWIWVILEGEVEIVKETERGPLKILKVGEGAFLGSIAALIEGEVRSATTVASGHVQLGGLDAQRLTAEFSKMSLSFRNLMISLDKRLRQVTDHAVRLDEQKDNLKEYLAGKRPLIKQGDDEERIFTITQGEADIIRK